MTAATGGDSEKLVIDGHCFACGPLSVIGLKLVFQPSGEGEVRCDTVLAQRYQGWVGVAHGGIVMTLLDEAMAHAAGWAGVRGVTAEVNTRFRKPVPLGVPIVITGRIEWQRRNVFGIVAEVRGSDGTLLAGADGKLVAKGTVDPGQLGVPDPA